MLSTLEILQKEAEKERFQNLYQEKLNNVLYKFSRKHKNPAVFPLYKDGPFMGIILSCIGGKWDEEVRCVLYDTNTDYHDYYKEHDMLILMNQTYGHEENKLVIKTTTSLEFKLDKFIPVILIEYQLKNDNNDNIMNIVLCPNWNKQEITW